MDRQHMNTIICTLSDAVQTYAYALQRIRYKKKITSNIAPQQRGHKDTEWGYIPYNAGHICTILINLSETYKHISEGRAKFLDIGCGMGNIIIIAKSVGLSVEGIERDKTTFRHATKIVGNIGKIHNANMLTFKDYGKYDVLYYYVPIKDHVLMAKAANRIASQMKIGAIMIPMGFGHPFESSPMSFKTVPNIYAFEKIAEYKPKYIKED